MKRKLTEAEVLARLAAAVLESGSVAELARRWGCTPAYLFRVQSGKDPIGPKVLAGLGLRRVELYEPIGPG